MVHTGIILLGLQAQERCDSPLELIGSERVNTYSDSSWGIKVVLLYIYLCNRSIPILPFTLSALGKVTLEDSTDSPYSHHNSSRVGEN